MLKEFLGVIRVPFLLLVPACLAPAFAVAYYETGSFNWQTAVLVFVAALASHIAVNALNEYDDFKSGLDFATNRTPFSGGSGTLVNNSAFAPATLYVGLVSLLATFSIGGYFVWDLGASVILPGLLGLVIIVTYTRWINRFPLLCLAAPGVGFGLIMVNLTVLVMVGQVTPMALAVSLTVSCLVSNLLLLNQFPDIDADRRVGRNHIAIAWGASWASRCYVLLMLVAYFAIVLFCLLNILPYQGKLALLTLPLAVWVAFRVLRFDSDQTTRLVPAMAANVAVTLITPVLLAVGIIWAK